MRKIFSLFFVLILVLSFASCNKDPNKWLVRTSIVDNMVSVGDTIEIKFNFPLQISTVSETTVFVVPRDTSLGVVEEICDITASVYSSLVSINSTELEITPELEDLSDYTLCITGEIKFFGGRAFSGTRINFSTDGEDPPVPTPCTVGTIGPSGGYIFFCDDPNSKLLPTDKLGLEAAPADLGGSHKYSNITNVAIGEEAQGTAIGTGAGNTAAIIDQGAISGAAKECDDLTVGGESDWFLPSQDELDAMYTNLYNQTTPIGGFSNVRYWSSSERNATDAWFQRFDDGSQDITNKTVDSFSVRCARAF
jgi:hypothetical protein